MINSKYASLFLFGLMAGLPSVAAAKAPEELGHMAYKERVVKKSLPCQEQPAEMNLQDPVKEGMCVQTEKESWADFSVGSRGKVGMGPESRFEFREGRFNPETGELKMDFEIMWGIFRFAFAPPDGKQEAGTIKIMASGRWIYLYGTDVSLRVEKNGATFVCVAQGEVAVDGLEPRVKAGEWTTFGKDGSPQQPKPVEHDRAWPCSPAWGTRDSGAGAASAPAT